MARPLVSYAIIHTILPFPSNPISIFYPLITILSVFSLVTFLCASNKSKKSQRKVKEKMILSTTADESSVFEGKLVSRLNSSISSRALSMAKMTSWRKVQEDATDGDETGDEEELWRKKIIRGERCRPLEFSGKIVYDSQGNLLRESSDQ